MTGRLLILLAWLFLVWFFGYQSNISPLFFLSVSFVSSFVVFIWPRPFSKPKTAEKKEEAYRWLEGIEQCTGKKFYVLDRGGNVLAPKNGNGSRHLLDLVSDPNEAQILLRSLERGTKTKEIPMGKWRTDEGEERFLLVWN